MTFLSRSFGSAMIITGTSVGAGMLAIPATVAACGFWISCLLLVIVWFVMYLSALLLVEVNLSMKSGSNFTSMAVHTLGKSTKILTWISYLMLLYSLTAAYTSGGAGLIRSGFYFFGVEVNATFSNIIFIMIFGSVVYIGTFVVDQANKILMLVKFISFFSFLFVILPHIQSSLINFKSKGMSHIWVTFPILLTSFSYHHIIPSLRVYTNSDKMQLRRAILVGSLIPLVVYILWVMSTLGSIPVVGATSFQSIIHSGDITSGIVESYNSPIIGQFAYLFETVSVTTSFLGVTLGLYHFNLDTYSLSKNSAKSKIFGFIITFLPPLIYLMVYPKGFIIALGYASFFCAFLLIILPSLMAWSLRTRLGINNLKSKGFLILMFSIGLLIIIIEILSLLHILP